ncbi:hypothetical protein SK128_014232 [Halocaridina rubra]|uniref:Thioredoxin-like fold domain-containing protein n=1 Tax=Halocaridina rubra TaxID=373956 RepID=A0AAN8XDL9_HALRR
MIAITQINLSNPWIARGCVLSAGLLMAFLAKETAEWWKKKKLRREWNSVGKDVVILHQFIRGKYCLNLSPYALKVETFLRLANIKYVVDSDSPYGPKGKCPWITLNGEDLGDSEIIIRRLVQDFKVELNNHLDNRRKAELEAVRIMADEYVFWCVITWRYWLDGCVTFLQTHSFPTLLNPIFPFFMTRAIRDKAVMHGFGVHTPDEIYEFSKTACKTLSKILGKSLFVFRG